MHNGYVVPRLAGRKARSEPNCKASPGGSLDAVHNEVRYCKWTWLISGETTGRPDFNPPADDKGATEAGRGKREVNFTPSSLRFDNRGSHLYFFRIFRARPISIMRFRRSFRACRSKFRLRITPAISPLSLAYNAHLAE